MSFRRPARVGAYEPGFTLNNYWSALSDGYYLSVLGQTLWIGAVTAAICLVVGFPVAYNLARGNPRWTGLLYTLVLSPLLVGVVIRTFGWLIILSGNGVANRFLRDIGLIDAPLRLMNNEFGVIVGLVHVMLPLMILPLLSSLQAVNPALELAAPLARRIALDGVPPHHAADVHAGHSGRHHPGLRARGQRLCHADHAGRRAGAHHAGADRAAAHR